jgi:hypothetical protein
MNKNEDEWGNMMGTSDRALKVKQKESEASFQEDL